MSNVAISFIETGRTLNPNGSTREALVSALNGLHAEQQQRQQPPPENSIKDEEAAEAVRAESEELEVPGIGSLEGFDPHSIETVPAGPGVYVFYDVSDRPIYVGRSKSVRRRVRSHQDRFWFKTPIVSTAYYLNVTDARLRNQIEKVLIQFLKTNAVINQVFVDRDAEED